MGLGVNRGLAQLDQRAWNEWAHMRLLAAEKLLLKKEERLTGQARVLEPIAARTEPYPLPRLPNGRLTSVPKANASLLHVRKQLSSVIAQRQGVQARLGR